jgi:isoleucyl-tRNA synthetase
MRDHAALLLMLRLLPMATSLAVGPGVGRPARMYGPRLFSATGSTARASRVARPAKKGGEDAAVESAYSSTVSLPKTNFDQRANAVKREPELQAFWKESRIYERLYEENPGKPFTLHDGPPYANGDLHTGHALNKILKDMINRFQMMQGRKVRYVPGWDCHGLPIELKVLQGIKSSTERRSLTPLQLRERASTFALEAVDRQREQFKRFGVWADWDKPYLTLDPAYEAAQLGVFGAMALNGHIYRGKKPVHWSPSTRTALAEAELEYPEGHTSRSIYVAMELVGPSPALATLLAGATASLAIWTTTPWTIPANLAIAINEKIQYALVEVGGRKLVVAKELAAALGATLSRQADPAAEPLAVTHLGSLSGAELAGSTYRHPLEPRESAVVVGGDYITTESGTGLVHTAPGHGRDDYLTGMKYGLPLLSPVDDGGLFTAEAGARLEGKSVLDDGNAEVIVMLREVGALLAEEAYAHKYPYDWRSKKPTIFRATEQWFASVEGFRDAALAAIDTVEWLPASGRNRITAMTEGRADWCISRQRAWGVPIPVFYHKETNEPLLTPETVEHVRALVAARGSNVWWEATVAELLPEALRGQAEDYVRGTDTMDVWFDSGSSWSAVAEARPGLECPADLYLEGSDQHRGWFQSSLLTSVAARGQAPYKAVLTHVRAPCAAATRAGPSAERPAAAASRARTLAARRGAARGASRRRPAPHAHTPRACPA